MSAPFTATPASPAPHSGSTGSPAWIPGKHQRGTAPWNVRNARGVMIFLSLFQLIGIALSGGNPIAFGISAIACLVYAGCAAFMPKDPVLATTVALAVLGTSIAFIVLALVAGAGPGILIAIVLPMLMLRDLLKGRQSAIELTNRAAAQAGA
jgi:hypothetical protein